MKTAKEIVEGFPSHYSFEQRKQMGVESVEMVIKELLMGKTYEGIQIRLNALNELKLDIYEL